MVAAMRNALLFGLCVMLFAATALAGPALEEEGPLSPCVPSQDISGSASANQPPQAWGIVIATAFSKDEALAEFNRVKQDHAGILGNYEAIVVETCDLHMGTQLQYSARIGMDSREDADNLCAKIQAAGGACIVQKN